MFRMTVDDVFLIRGRGLIATGKVESGTLRVGDSVYVNSGRSVRVDGIEAFRKILEQAQPGQYVGVLFRELDKGAVQAGDVIADEAASGGVAPPPPPSFSARDPRFAQVEAQRTQLLSMRETGLMTDEQIDEALRRLMFTADGRHWVLNAASEQWYSSDGGAWKRDAPRG